ncbi:glycosyltransferase family 4 protein [Patescibacteria group bacterium]|nr:glycosyltransferase family 4 protein [Patescibacteria group bacterium]
MKIGIDASRANEKKKTGVSWYAFHLIQELKKIIPDNVQVVLYSRESLQGELVNLPDNWTQKVLKWPPKKFWTQIRLSWEMMFHRPDVLFVPAHVFSIIHPKKTVMTVHDVAAVKFPESYNWFERWYSVWSARVALKKLWRIIVPTNFVATELKKQETRNKKQKDNIFAVHHGYDKRYKKIEDEAKIVDVLEKYGIKKPFIMTIGRIEEKKNTKRIVEAFDELRIKNYELRLVLVGKPGHGYEKVQATIGQSEFKDDIITPGWVDEEDLSYLINSAEVFVFPSLYEGFGIPVLEAMACGTPVVASKGSSLEEVGGEAVLYVDPKSVENIAETIKQLIDNKELREEKIKLGFERVKEFSWKKCAEKTLKILIEENQ